jgi:hypothetical protein
MYESNLYEEMLCRSLILNSLTLRCEPGWFTPTLTMGPACFSETLILTYPTNKVSTQNITIPPWNPQIVFIWFQMLYISTESTIIGICILSLMYQLNIRTPPYATNVSACLLCTLYTTCFGPHQWPSSGYLQYKIYLKAVTNISTDTLSQIYKRAKAVVKVILKIDSI